MGSREPIRNPKLTPLAEGSSTLDGDVSHILSAAADGAVRFLSFCRGERDAIGKRGAREGPAAPLAFSESYAGDRVVALSFGLLRMADAAFGDKTDFYLFDSLDEMKLYRCARNLEVAIWKLGNDRTAAGELFLRSNELEPARRNLSFEREFGRQIGLLDLLARVVADRQGRALSRLTQSAAVMVFLPIGGL